MIVFGLAVLSAVLAYGLCLIAGRLRRIAVALELRNVRDGISAERHR